MYLDPQHWVENNFVKVFVFRMNRRCTPTLLAGLWCSHSQSKRSSGTGTLHRRVMVNTTLNNSLFSIIN